MLIVDDDAGYRAIARRVVEAAGLEVVGEAADGESALDAVAARAPDGVLLDVQLPGLMASRSPSDSRRTKRRPTSC
jgi:DNA-binding NarL/FixJ family response regulator